MVARYVLMKCPLSYMQISDLTLASHLLVGDTPSIIAPYDPGPFDHVERVDEPGEGLEMLVDDVYRMAAISKTARATPSLIAVHRREAVNAHRR